MLFNSLSFIVFFAIVLLLHSLPLSWWLKKLNLLIASYVFYAAWNPPFVLLLWFSTLLDWTVGNRLAVETRTARRRLLLSLSLLGNLGLLGYFKYGGFVLENFVALVNSLGISYQPAAPSIILPVGISFYTFQTLCYSIDIYRRQIKPSSSFLDFSLFVTFFPQLVAGPIVRPGHMMPQFEVPRRASAYQFCWGLALLTLGLFEKVVLADTLLAPAADTVFRPGPPLHPLDAWTGVLAFSGQIFCDFAGYSTCAIGVALCLGFSLPDNFRAPYAAVGFSDFWRRWHITLSTWLRDYVYIPLGGNRRGIPRMYLALLLTMFLGGLWHGAAWTFVAWGVLHGLFLCIERPLRKWFGHASWTRMPGVQPGLALLTFALVSVTWVFFRSPDFPTAGRILGSMAGVIPMKAMVLPTFDILKVGGVMGLVLASHWTLRNNPLEHLVSRTPWWLLAITWSFMIAALIVTNGSGNAFIYFQF